MASDAPYSARPTSSCGSRRPSRPARSWATGPRSRSAGRRRGAVVLVMGASLPRIGLLLDGQSWDSGLHEPHHHRHPRGHPRRPARADAPALPRAGRAAAPAHRGGPDPGGHPTAQRARPHHRPRGQPHHDHPGVRRAARARLRRVPPRLRDRHPAAAARRVGHRPRLRPVVAGPRRHRPQLRRTERAGRRRGGVRRSGGRAPGLPLQPRLLPRRPPRASRPRSRRRTTSADCRPTPGQIIITAGALGAAAIVAQALTAPGDRVVVEDPVYPNATQALSHRSARLVPAPVDPDGWDIAATAAIIRQAAPRLAYLVPDFQNPTGSLMTDAQREEYAAALRRARVVAGRRRGAPGPGARRPGDAGAVRGPPAGHGHDRQRQQAVLGRPAARLAAGAGDDGAAAAPRPDEPRPGRSPGRAAGPAAPARAPARRLGGQPARLRTQREALLDGLATGSRPGTSCAPAAGWRCGAALPQPRASALVAEAERRGVVVAAGRVFAVEGGLEHHVRIPWTRSADQLGTAVDRLRDAWDVVARGGAGDGGASRASPSPTGSRSA